MVILFGFCFYIEIGVWLLVNVLSNGLCGLWCVFVLLNEKNIILEVCIVEVVYIDGNNVFVCGVFKDGEIYVNEGIYKLVFG